MNEERSPFGRVVRGSLSRGLEVHLDEGQSIEALRAGQFAVLQGREHEFFGMITDLGLASVNDGPLDAPPPQPLLDRIVRGTALYGTATVRLSLMSPSRRGGRSDFEPQPAKTVPGHFSAAFSATAEDVGRVFGEDRQGDASHFEIGSPLEMAGIPLCLRVDRLVERSSGIFGKSGTGKTFLTRLALSAIMRNRSADAPVALVFDMHNEYGQAARIEGEDGKRTVIGLQTLFGPGRVEVFAVGRRTARRVDFDVHIPYSQIEPEDVLLLHEELRLHRTAAESAYLLHRKLGKQWLRRVLEGDPEELAGETEANRTSLQALINKLRFLQHQCEAFLVPDDRMPSGPDPVERILSNLLAGRSTIVEFGNCRAPVQYMLVANILSRRLHERYVTLMEKHLTEGNPAPRPLVIAIEEAHKFLSPTLADQTIFGTIAREMRKYNVTLLVVDQRPSGIDPEILSQLGTKLACLLDNDRDVEAVLSGVSNGSGLRGVLASLATRRQALIMGHAVPMPVVIDTRVYGDEAFLRAMDYQDPAQRKAAARRDIEATFS